MRLSIILVCYGEDVTKVLAALAEQKAPGDELIVVDNKSAEGGTPTARGHPAIDVLIEPSSNLHYAQGINLGAERATGDAVLLLNPDAVPDVGFLDAMRLPPVEWAGWTGVLTLPDREHVNNGGGEVHYLGFAWSGRYGERVSSLPTEPYPAGFLSGGCMAVRREVWEALGGYPAHYGVYHEDTDLSLRLRLEGLCFGVVPAARVAHEYDFVKNLGKWRRIEINRWKTVLRTYPAPLLVAALPLLLAVEPALLAVAARRGWGRMKVESWQELVRWLPAARADRRLVQARRRVSVREFADGLVPELNSPFFGRIGRLPSVRLLLSAYWRLLLAALPG